MDLVFPSESPKSLNDLLEFIQANFLALQQLTVQRLSEELAIISFEHVQSKAIKGSEEHGPWSLFKIDTIAEIRHEAADLMAYTAWHELQKHFSEPHES